MKKTYINNSSIQCKFDFSILTVVFKLCCNSYSYSTIEWKYKDIIVEKYTLKDKCYLSIQTAVPFNAIVTQFDTNNNILFSLEVSLLKQNTIFLEDQKLLFNNIF